MSDETTTTPTEAPAAWPDPAERIRPGAEGVPVALADGRAWLLATSMPTVGGVWNRLYDARQVRGQYEVAEVRTASFRLLTANYDLTPEEAYELIIGVRPAALVPAVETALLGPDQPQRSYSEWITLALCLCGLNPDHVAPARRLPIALALEAAGRCPPRHEYITSARMAARRAEVLQLAQETARPTPAP